MDESISRLTEEIDNVGRKVIRTYEEGSFAEQENVKRQLQRYHQECSDIFKHYMGIVPNKVIDDITAQTEDLLKKEIEQARTNECRDNMERLGQVRKPSTQEMANGLQDFKEQGVMKNNNYDDKVDEIIDRVTRAYRSVLERVPSRNGDMVFDEIRGSTRRTFNNIKEVHDECTKIIEKEVMKEVESFGFSLSQTQVEEVKSKSDKAALDFGEQLKNEYCASEEEVKANDLRDIREEKDTQNRENRRKELESMFK